MANYKKRWVNLGNFLLNNQFGFTITELIVSVSIFVILTVILLANFRSFEKEAVLETSADELATILRQAQIWALIGQTYAGSRPAGGWGVHIDGVNNKYFLFKDTDECELWEVGEEIQTFDLSSSLSITTDMNKNNIAFKFPKAQVFIEAYCSGGGNCTVGGICTAGTLTSFDDITITLTHQTTGNTKQITVNRISGQINIQ